MLDSLCTKENHRIDQHSF